jgi:nucleoid DNA-binding protein
VSKASRRDDKPPNTGSPGRQLTRDDVVRKIAEEASIPMTVSLAAIETMLTMMREVLATEGRLQVWGLGVFRVAGWGAKAASRNNHSVSTGVDGVVPVAMESMGLAVDLGHLGVGDHNPLGVEVLVDLGADVEPRGGGG